jgi:hypothetical protein
LCVLAVQTNGPFGGDSDAGIQSDTLLSTVNFNVSKASVVSHIQVDVRDHGDKKSNVTIQGNFQTGKGQYMPATGGPKT